MKNERLFDRRKLSAVCTVLFLSPALRLVPGRSAELAGRGAWVSVLAAVPVLLGYAYFLSVFCGRRGEGEGMDGLILRCLGDRIGSLILIAFSAWLLLYCAFMLRAGADRIIRTIYPQAEPEFFIVVMVLLGLWASLGSERAIVRCAKLVLPPVLGVLFFVLIGASPDVRMAALLPLNKTEGLQALKASFVTVDVAVLPMYLSLFLGGGRDGKDGGYLSSVLWLIFMVFLLSWMQICLAGFFGAELTAKLSQPFFVLSRNIVLFRSLERPEALVVSMWVFSDFILTSVCLSASQRLLRCSMGKRCDYCGEKKTDISNGRWVIWLCAALSGGIASVMAPDSTVLSFWSEKLIPYINLFAAFVLLPVIFLVGKIRKRL